MPAITIQYELTGRELAEQERALAHLERAGMALGEFPTGGEPRVMPKGSSIHYMGTVRMGEADDGTSVCDPRRGSGASTTSSSAATASSRPRTRATRP